MHLCSHCRSFTGGKDSNDSASVPIGVEEATSDPFPASTNAASSCCAVCLGLWDDYYDDDDRRPNLQGLNNDADKEFEDEGRLSARLRDAIRRALVPYGNPGDNRWSQASNVCAPSMGLPGDLVYRCMLDTRTGDGPNQRPSWETVLDRSSRFGQLAKERAKDLLGEALTQIPTKSPNENDETSVMDREEQGYLGLYVLLVPSSATPRPVDRLGSDSSHRKRKRRIFPGQPQQQGGDPRANLEARLEAQGVVTWTINQALLASKDMDRSFLAQDDLLERPLPLGPALDIHVAIWRRPFYVRGEYTKSRRGVPQSPFFVVEGGHTVRLGETSVEEQIAPAVSKHCGGMSQLNNNGASGRDVVYGATKFHASGREDMDVRMLIRSKHPSSSGKIVTGRPFVCEVIDAYRMPTSVALVAMANEINHLPHDSVSTTVDDRNGRQKHAAGTNGAYYYGSNPTGVGVSALSIVSSASFKSLQAETESKVKHYGCLCWSETVLSTTVESIELDLGWSFPVTIAQRTPLRVLHRRAPAVRQRHILTGSVVERVDDHYFRLRLSTDAGTYVKEFVHGDLGRTVPSASSMLQCRTDILELDCEGVETDPPREEPL
jgi:tRNA U54 and U55 pseudouridine synthase Pus10